MKLAFVSNKLPRTITKAEWKTLWRWKRVMEKELKKHEDVMIEAAKQMLIYGQARVRIIDDLINPPLMVLDESWLK
jgi:hypothetical protein